MRRRRFLHSLALLLLAVMQEPSLLAATIDPAPTEEQTLAEVREFARRHSENDSPMQTGLVLEVFHERKVSRQAIARTYEQEYTRVRAASQPWYRRINQLGWVAAVVLFVAFCGKEWLKSAVSRVLGQLASAIYRHVSGTSPFRRVALRRYRRALQRAHTEVKVPFRPGRPLRVADLFVPLRVAGGTCRDEVNADDAIREIPRLMLKGPPGSGKSMLLRYAALCYAEERIYHMSGRTTPVLLELHRLSEPGRTIEQHIEQVFERNDFPNASAFVQRALSRGDLLLLFDGLDEVRSSERARVVKEIKDLVAKHPDTRIVCTCRSAVYREDLSDCVDQTLEIAEFKDHQIRRFLKGWERDLPGGKSVDELLQRLSDRPRIMAMARNPLLLTIIAYLYSDTPFQLPHSRAEFYDRAISILLDIWHHEQNHYKARDKRLVLQHLALFHFDASGLEATDQRTISASVALQEVRKVLPNLNLSADEDAARLLDEIVERSGLLLAIDGGSRYAFAHLTLQEFLAAEHLRKDEGGVMARLERDPNAWRETAKLWCGVVPECTSFLRKVFASSPALGLECLGDAQAMDPMLAEAIVKHFEERMADLGGDEAALQAFAGLASDDRPRGRAVFARLAGFLQQPDAQRRAVAAQILSKTNSRRAAELLAEAYDGSPMLRNALLHLGELAVPALSKRAEADTSGQATEALAAIGTVSSVAALAGVMWCADETCASLAAWHLSAVLRAFEPSLRNHPLTLGQRAAPRLDWVWEPFEEPEDSALPILAGRAAWLMDRGDPPGINLPADPRLVIPLCALRLGSEYAPSSLESDEVNEERKEVVRRLEAAVGKSVSSNTPLRSIIFDFLGNAGDLTLMHSMLSLANVGTLCRFQLGCLPMDAQFDLVERIHNGPTPTKRDWTLVFKPVNYQFTRGWHYRANVVLVSLLCVVSIFLTWRLRNQPLQTLATWIHARALPDSAWIWLMATSSLVWLIIWFLLLKVRRDKEDVCVVHGVFALGCPICGLPFLILAWSTIALILVDMAVLATIILIYKVRRYPDLGETLAIVGVLHVAIAVLAVGCAPLLTIAIYGTAWASRWVSWIGIAGGWAALVGVFVFIWTQGFRLDRAAQNPLRSILEAETPLFQSKRAIWPVRVLAQLFRMTNGPWSGLAVSRARNGPR